ncbi:MAG: DUF58 domain-containing protein [Rubripirellula sp.]
MSEMIQQLIGDPAQWQVKWPWLIFALLSSPIVAVAWRLRIFPAWPWIALIASSLVISIGVVFLPSLFVIAIFIDLLLLLVAAADLVWLYLVDPSDITVSRRLPNTCSLGVPFISELRIENRARGFLNGLIRDDLPEGFSVDPPSHSLSLAPLDELRVHRRLTPKQRGAFFMERVDLRIQSPLKLWNRYLTFKISDSLNVYPNLRQLADYALLAKTDRLSLIGVRKKRKIGQDNEFERLREYTRDDNYRHIDWRSTAKRGKLTVKQFQSEQSQRIIFLLDCGRMMVNERDGVSLLDHALNSILMMAHVALQQGDSVGLLCFSDRVHCFIPPRSGKSQLNRLIHAGFDQFPQLVEARYDQAFLYLANHCTRRSMVILATNVIDEVNAGSIVNHLTHLRGPHLPVGVLMRDRNIYDAVEADLQNEQAVYRAAAAADVLLWRDQVLRDLTHRGVLVVDAFPDQLSAPLVNQYLEIKAKHLL